MPLVTWGLVAVNVLVFILMSGLDRTDPEARERLQEKAWLDPVVLGLGGIEGKREREEMKTPQTTPTPTTPLLPQIQPPPNLSQESQKQLEALNKAMQRIQAMMQGRGGPERPDGYVNWGWWTVITYQFVHGGFMHILGNMIFLWVFGPAVEDRLGRMGFLLFYLIGGVLAGITHAAFEPHPVIGASGAIAAVTGAFLVLFPRTHVKLFVFFVMVGIVEFPVWIFIALAVAKDLWGIGTQGEDVAFLAHIGGYLMGFSVAMIGLLSGLLHEEEWSLLAVVRQHKRRAEFKMLARDAEAEWKKKTEAITEKKPRGVEERVLWQRVDKTEAEAAKAAEDGAVAAARAKVQAALLDDDQAGAVEAYRSLRRLAKEKGLPPLARRHQVDMANMLMALGHHAEAADAYEAFLSAAKGTGDPEEPRVRLMLALVCQRYLGDKGRAGAALAGIKGTFHEPDLHELAAALKAEITGEKPA